MKIAHIAPHWSPYQEDRLIGIKRIIYYLHKEQTKRGHEVYIIAPKGSTSDNPNKLITTIESLRDFNIYASDPRSLYYGVAHASIAAQEAEKFDILHSHIEQVFLPFIPLIKTPVISTIHGTEFNKEEQYIYKSFYNQFNAVSISKKSEEFNQGIINFNTQIYNGVDISTWSLNLDDIQNYILFIGRINPNKGVLEAVKIANQVQKKLKIVGIKEISAENYFDQVISEVNNSDFVKYEGEIFESDRKFDLYSKAKLFLFPVKYEETFASTPLESMATGTPVVAFSRGSLPEQVKDGETGFLVNPKDDDIRGDWIIKKTGIDGLQEAIDRIYSMPRDKYEQMRRNCRKRVEEHFSVERMVENYEKVYQEVIKK